MIHPSELNKTVQPGQIDIPQIEQGDTQQKKTQPFQAAEEKVSFSSLQFEWALMRGSRNEIFCLCRENVPLFSFPLSFCQLCFVPVEFFLLIHRNISMILFLDGT